MTESSVMLDIGNIDELIRFWRKAVIEAKDDEKILIARCYVDAFQTVRVNHGLELLAEVIR